MTTDFSVYWNAVPLNERRPCACSPPVPAPAWQGILLNAPLQVHFQRGLDLDGYGAWAAVPLCMFYRVPATEDPRKQVEWLVAEDVATGRVYQGRVMPREKSTMLRPDQVPACDPPPFDPEVVHGGYLNPNLVSFVPIPVKPATYEVFAGFGGLNSNRVRIQLIEDPAPVQSV